MFDHRQVAHEQAVHLTVDSLEANMHKAQNALGGQYATVVIPSIAAVWPPKTTTSESCTPGYGDLLCMSCQPEYAKGAKGDCQLCATDGRTEAFALVAVFGILVVLMVVAYKADKLGHKLVASRSSPKPGSMPHPGRSPQEEEPLLSMTKERKGQGDREKMRFGPSSVASVDAHHTRDAASIFEDIPEFAMQIDYRLAYAEFETIRSLMNATRRKLQVVVEYLGQAA